MKKTSSSAVTTTKKKSQQNQILDRLFDYFSRPKGDKPSSESDIEVSFYKSGLTAIPRSINDLEYSGVNILLLLHAQEHNETKVPIYSTFKQASDLLESHKENLPAKSKSFDPNKPLKGIAINAQVVKYLETYKKDGKAINKSIFEHKTEGMSFSDMIENGYQKRKVLRTYNVFPIEKIKHLLPKKFIDDREYFSQQEELEKKKMSPEMEDITFVEKAQVIIDAMKIKVIERNQDRAFYSPTEDIIVIPPRHKFISDKAYFALVLHEICHATAHPERLNRPINAFNSIGYKKEELVAECATMFMCLEEGIETFHSHAAYLEGYASSFKDKKKILLNICKEAREAQKYICRKVMMHKLDLSIAPVYKVPKKLDFELKLEGKHADRLADYIVTNAKNYSSLIPLKNHKILGYNEIKGGIDVFTPEKKVSLVGGISSGVQRELDNLKLLQSIILEVASENNIEGKSVKNNVKSTRLLM